MVEISWCSEGYVCVDSCIVSLTLSWRCSLELELLSLALFRRHQFKLNEQCDAPGEMIGGTLKCTRG